MKHEKNKHTTAFTLLEILLVVAAIAILATIVIVAINPQRQLSQFRDAQRQSHQNSLTSAITQYLIDNGTYPSQITTTLTEICDTGTESEVHTIDCDNLVDLSVLVPTYIPRIPKDPTTQTTTGYFVSTNHDSSRLAIITNKESISCPEGYIPVPGNPIYGTEDFCVMKYEAKAMDTENNNQIVADGGASLSGSWAGTSSQTRYRATSTYEGRPWVNIAQNHSTNYDALQACQDIGARLISNKEWMTIARNIESVGTNWTGGTVGESALVRGHSNGDPNNSLAATTDDGNGTFGINNPAPINRRTHTLTNGQVIWDMAGNVWNWTDEVVPTFADQPNNSSSPASQTWIEWTTVDTYGAYTYDDWRPSNPEWNATNPPDSNGQGTGRYFPLNITNRAVRRSADWNENSNVGIFTVNLAREPELQGNIVGFRCVFSGK